MNWYAIQLRIGKEKAVIADFTDHGIKILWPRRPIFILRKGIIRLQYKPLLPGYIFAKIEVPDFYKEKRNGRIDGMMIRICGDWYDAVSLTQNDLSFFKFFLSTTKPVLLTKAIAEGSQQPQAYSIMSPPPWWKDIKLDWYDKRQLEAKLQLKTSNEIKYHSFKIAACCFSDISDRLYEQNKKLLTDCYG